MLGSYAWLVMPLLPTVYGTTSKRKEEQARFVQLFEDDESLEEEQDLKDDQIVDVWWLDLAPTTKKLDRGISI